MGVKCVYCKSRDTSLVKTNEFEDGGRLERWYCRKCNKIFGVLVIEKENYTRRIKLKAQPLPITYRMPDGREITITFFDVYQDIMRYLSLRKMGWNIPVFFDEEYVYYLKNLTYEYDGYFFGLYADGWRIARKSFI